MFRGGLENWKKNFREVTEANFVPVLQGCAPLLKILYTFSLSEFFLFHTTGITLNRHISVTLCKYLCLFLPILLPQIKPFFSPVHAHKSRFVKIFHTRHFVSPYYILLTYPLHYVNVMLKILPAKCINIMFHESVKSYTSINRNCKV